MALPPLSRVTIDTGSIPALVGRSFGLTVQANDPIIAERATYFETTPTQLWAGGHGSPGVPAPATTWYFAEGATTSFRDTFMLLSNPGDIAANVSLAFFPGNGNVVGMSATLQPHSRQTFRSRTSNQTFW